MATKIDEPGYSYEEAWVWLQMHGDTAADGTFHTTARKLMSEWNRSAYWVMEFLKRLEAEGDIRRHTLPDNGGTLITIISQHENGDKPTVDKISLGSGMPGHRSQFIENIPPVLSAQQADRLTRVYRGIIYGEPGYEWADVEHLEIIEWALCPSQVRQAA